VVHEVHAAHNPLFPHMQRPEPIPPNVDHGLSFVSEFGADVAIINDGDADRVGFGDENGAFIDQLRVYGLLGYYFLEIRGERGPIVKSFSTTRMLNKLGDLYGVPVYETGVGFKYIAPKIKEVGAMIGGEESGGYAFRGHVPERDGILAGLYLLDLMVKTGKKPSQLLDWLFAKVGPIFTIALIPLLCKRTKPRLWSVSLRQNREKSPVSRGRKAHAGWSAVFDGRWRLAVDPV
jgi:phosphomannomutase